MGQEIKEQLSGFLELISEKLDKGNSLINESEKESFNIFQILGIENKEVLACRFLGSILEPNGWLDLGNKPLEEFLESVLRVNHKLEDDADITLEDVIENNRRVDIVIRNGEYIYPIEVKIWAGDQDSQIDDYYKYYFETLHYKDLNGDNKKIYYLTPTGWRPSTKSNKTSNENVALISFEKIRNWLSSLTEYKDIKPLAKSILKQYIEVIDSMRNESEVYNAILETIGCANDNFDRNNKNLKALIEVLSVNGDKNSKLQREIQKSYLLKCLDGRYKDQYEIISDMDADEEMIKNIKDNHALLYIKEKKKGKIIAWICVYENLYIGCKKLKEKYDETKWRDACWAYLTPERYSKEKFILNDCKNVLKDYGNIDISELLDDIAIDG